MTYNDDADAMVQTFCDNATRFDLIPNRMAKWPPAYAPHVKVPHVLGVAVSRIRLHSRVRW